MATYGPNAAGLGRSIASGTVAWVGPGNITANDVLYAVVTFSDSGGGCFVAGTSVDTFFGQINIEDIQVGFFIKADNVGGVARVEKLISLEAQDLIVLTFKDFEIKVTPEHPFVLDNGELITAEALQINECISGKKILNKQHLAETCTVYNLSVSEPHTFVVHGIRVHNK